MIGNDDFGLALQDGEFDVGPNVVVGGVGGVAVIAFSDNATARVRRVRVAATSGPALQEFACCGFAATAIG